MVIEKTIRVYEFIKKVIVHVPDRYFNMVRYYGLYAKMNDLFKLHRSIPPHVQREANHWWFRILTSFRFDPRRCKCGKMMHGTIHPNSYLPKVFSKVTYNK